MRLAPAGVTPGISGNPEEPANRYRIGGPWMSLPGGTNSYGEPLMLLRHEVARGE
jgi:hypothetical protein